MSCARFAAVTPTGRWSVDTQTPGGRWRRRRESAPPRGVRLRGAAQLSDVELVEGEFEYRVRILWVLYAVPDNVARLVGGRDRPVARREVHVAGERRVSVGLVLVLVVPHREVAAPVDTSLAEVHRAGLGKGRPELVAAREEGDVLDEVAVDMPHHGVVRARVGPLGIIEDAVQVRRLADCVPRVRASGRGEGQ